MKQEKCDAIKLLDQSKLDSIANIISETMQCINLSCIDFHNALKKVEQYLKVNADIRKQGKTKVKHITKEQQEKLLKQRRKVGNKDSLQKIRYTLDIQDVNII